MTTLLLDRPDLVGPWVYARFPFPRPFDGAATAIGVVVANELVAGVVYSQYNVVNVWTAIAADSRVRWASRAVLFVLFDYPFRQLGVKRITVAVDESNIQSQDFVSRLGFEPETRLIDASPGGDLLIYRMRREACPWLSRDSKCQKAPRPARPTIPAPL